jgi:pilus assembly protein Flp/PilA
MGEAGIRGIYSTEFKEITMTTLMVSVLAFVSGIKDRLASEKGATATEYSLLIAFVAFAIIVGAALFGTALSDWFSRLANVVAGWTTGPA